MRSWLLVPLAVAVVACGGDRAYRVGVIGRNPAFEGADLAVREVDGANGINGVPLRTQRGDTAAVVKGDSTKMADKLAGDSSVIFLLQQTGQGVPPQLLRVYYTRALPVLVLGPVLGKPDGRWVFHLMPSAKDEAALMAGQAEKLWQPKRVAIVHSNDAYGVMMAAELSSALPQGSKPVTSTAFVETTDTVPAAQLVRVLTAANPDVIFWLGPPRVLGILLVRLRLHLPQVRIMGSDAAEAKRIYDNADGVFSGLVFVRAADPAVDTARYNNFRYRYSVWMGGDPTSDAVLAYDATSMIAAAMRAGASTRAQVRDYLTSLGKSRPPYTGITGPISFDSVGVIRRPFILAEVRDDGVKPVPLLK
ncbi:MAG TPA: ABC transporter substrate-binding protein [Longimicrobiales bacterium]